MEPKISYLELLKPFHIKPREEIYYIEALTHSSYAHEHHEENLKQLIIIKLQYLVKSLEKHH